MGWLERVAMVMDVSTSRAPGNSATADLLRQSQHTCVPKNFIDLYTLQTHAAALRLTAKNFKIYNTFRNT